MIKSLKKYFEIYAMIFKTSVTADLQYRMNFASRIVTDIFWYTAQILLFEVLYKHTKTIGDWNIEQTRVFLGMLFVIDAFYMIILHDNLDQFLEKIRKGDLDLLLAKPINSQFMMSCQRVATALIGNLMIGLSWFAWSLYQLPEFNWFRLLWLIILIPNCFLVLYALRFAFCAVALIFQGSTNFQFVWFQFYKLAMRPTSIYGMWLKILLYTIVPVGVIVTVPAKALLDPPDFLLFGWTLVLGPICLYLSSRFWKYCLSFYSSASS